MTDKPKAAPAKRNNSTDVLATMYEAQAEQFQRATLLAVGVVMKKLGVQEVTISLQDVDALSRDETLAVNRNMDGSLVYTLKKIARATSSTTPAPATKKSAARKKPTTRKPAARKSAAKKPAGSK